MTLSIETVLEELLSSEKARLRTLAYEILGSGVTDDDLLQPNDFPELEMNPYFRYQEGIVSGLLTFEAAWRLSKNEAKEDFRTPNALAK